MKYIYKKIDCMKKYCIVLSLSIFCFACGNEPKKTETKDETSSTTSVMDNPDYDKGLNLIAKSDCLTCHKVEEKNIGPAYRDVANKYEATPANITMLAAKVIKGGQGVWGAVPMTPHPAITQADAEQMVKYVMLLKNK